MLSRLFFFEDLLRGFSLAFLYSLRPSVTLMFPFERASLSPRFRGIHALRRWSNSEERCISCKLCESICPALAISIIPFARPDGARKSLSYDLDLTKCIFCGFCQEACPVDAIVESPESSFSVFSRDELLLSKSQLLLLGDRLEPVLHHSILADHLFR
jgi:NADH dehydrogenase (ubiquinone) Fe-S protein 8